MATSVPTSKLRRLFSSFHGTWAVSICLFATCLLPLPNSSAQQTATAKATQNASSAPAAIELFSQDSVVYLEIAQPSEIVDLVMNHPLNEKILEIPEIKKGLSGKEMFQFRAVVALIEGHIGMSWQEGIAFATSGGVSLAVDAETKGVALIAKSKDGAQLQTMVDNLVKLAKLDENRRKEIKQQDYRGFKAYAVRDTIVAVMGDSLLVTNKPDLAKKIADGYLDGTNASLAKNETFQKARAAKSADASAWAYVDLEKLRQAPNAEKALHGKAQNIFVELLLGGLQSVLQNTEHASAELHLSETSIKLALQTPNDPAWIPQSRDYYFGPQNAGTAPGLLVPQRTLLNLTSYRDLSKMWLAKEDLLREKDISDLAQADSTFSTLFGGLDFGQEVLGAAKPGLRFVVAQQDFSKVETPEPEIKLPGFAFIFELNDPEAVQRRFKVGFQSMIGFVNIQLGQQEMPQLDIETITRDNARLITATYLPEKNVDAGLINYNFSPTIAFKDQYFIISSTAELANELVDLGDQPQPAQAGTNSLITIDANIVTELLDQNRESLISSNMLEEGHDRAQAEKEIGMLIELARMIKGAELKLVSAPEELKLELELQLHSVSTANQPNGDVTSE
jgi:hypothetical protein